MNQQTENLVRLVGELWPKWRMTEAVVELMLERFEGIDPDCVQRALQNHRLERSSVPDLGAIVDGARAAQDAKLRREEHAIAAQARKYDARDDQRARERLATKEPAMLLFLWQYCRNMSRHRVPWSELEGWPPHWSDPAPAPSEWPSAVVAAYVEMAPKMGAA